MNNDYTRILLASDKASWHIDRVLPEGTRFDLSRPLLPEALVHADMLGLDRDGQQLVNAIRASSYLHVFGLVEEFILPFVLDHARGSLSGSFDRIQALLRFAEEEAKHIELFRRFSRLFRHSFGTRCDGIGPADEIGRAVLQHSPLGVALAILHIEWMTQDHYLRAVKNQRVLEPAFADLLRFHWMEEAQHARLDGLVAQEIAGTLGARKRQQAFADYVAILDLFDAGFAQQVELDLESYRRAGGTLSPSSEECWRPQQHASYREVFLLTGLRRPRFADVLRSLVPDAQLSTVVARYLPHPAPQPSDGRAPEASASGWA